MINYFLGKRCSTEICCDLYEGTSLLLGKTNGAPLAKAVSNLYCIQCWPPWMSLYMVQYRDCFFQQSNREDKCCISNLFFSLSFSSYSWSLQLANGVVAKATVRVDVPNCTVADQIAAQ